MLAIMGPSGSGKTTLLDLLAGRKPSNLSSSGTIKVNGKDTKMSYGKVAYVPQNDLLTGALTVRETLHMTACLRCVDIVVTSCPCNMLVIQRDACSYTPFCYSLCLLSSSANCVTTDAETSSWSRAARCLCRPPALLLCSALDVMWCLLRWRHQLTQERQLSHSDGGAAGLPCCIASCARQQCTHVCMQAELQRR